MKEDCGSTEVLAVPGQVKLSARLGPASLHQKTRTHKPEAHGSVTICVWYAQVLPFVIPQLSTGMDARPGIEVIHSKKHGVHKS